MPPPPARTQRRLALVAALLAAVAFTALPAAADPDDRLNDIERQKALLQEQIAETEAQGDRLAADVRGLDEQRTAAQAQVEISDAQLALLDGRIVKVKRALTKAQKQLAVLSEELLDVQSRLVVRTDAFTDRAVAAYKAGPTAYLDSMLSSESFSDLVERYTYYESALDTDSELLAQIEVLRDDLETRRDVVEDKKDQIAGAKLRLEADRAEAARIRGERAAALALAEDALDKKASLLADVRGKEQQRRAALEQLERESSEIQAILAARTSSVPTSTGSAPAGAGQFMWPANGPVTSGYGYRTHPIFGDTRMHTGIDISAPYGAPVVAGDAGVVAYVGVMSGYGNVVVLDHGNGLATTYNHLSGFSVGTGESVGRGAPVGSVGCSGYCTGPHLHFEVRVNGSPVDPMPYLQ